MLLFKVRPRKSPTATAALTPSERRMMRVIGEAMLKVRRQVIRDETEILYAIEHGTASKVSSLISVDPWLDIQETIQEELFAELVSGGQRVKLPTIRKEVLSYRFDATRPEAANWAAKEAGTLIREIGEEQTNLVREYVSQASMGQYTPRQVARNLRDVIGLTSAQAGWVENFRNRQISEQMSRGKSYDQAYVASEKATERYHARIHRYRTETIARTEILRASHEGRREGWRQGIEEGYISAGASKQWSTELDGRECEICGPLDGETVLLDADFSDGEPPIHPNCRCDVLLVDDVDADLEGLTSEELDAIINDLLNEDNQEPQASNEEIPLKSFDEIANNSGEIYQNYLDNQDKAGDPMLSKMYELQGYNAPPSVITKSEMDVLEKAGKHHVVYRGVTEQWQTNEYKFGDHFAGKGVYGNGTYAATGQQTPLDYTGSPTPSTAQESKVMKIAIPKSSKIIDYDTAVKEQGEQWAKYIGGTDIAPVQVFVDVGRWATAQGYDAIVVKSGTARTRSDEDYYIILNRGKVTVQEENWIPE
jgi:hypothetical protein